VDIEPDTKDWTWVLARSCPECGLAAGRAIAATFESVPAAAWEERVGRRSNGSTFTVETLGQYFLHDIVHHLHDVRG
jgi:hypothetical protein